MVSLEKMQKYQAKNIIDACQFLEHIERYEKIPRLREFEKDMILNDMRLKKINDHINLLKEFDDASDPQTLKMMFIYKNITS